MAASKRITTIGEVRTGLFVDRFENYRRLTEARGTIFLDKQAGTWVVTGNPETMALLKMGKRLSTAFNVMIPDSVPLPRAAHEMLDHVVSVMKFNSGDGHRMPKQAMGPTMSGRAVLPDDGPFRTQVRTILDDLVARAARSGTFRLIDGVASPMPSRVVMGMIGMPSDPEEMRRITRLSNRAALPFTELPQAIRMVTDGGALVSGALAAYQMMKMMTAVVEGEARKPASQRTDLMNRMLAAEAAGKFPNGRTTTVANLMFLLNAGHETTTHAAAGGLLVLHEHAEQLEFLRANMHEPEVIKRAVAELLRYASPLQKISRYAADDIALNEFVPGDPRVIKAGERITFLIGAANRDQRVFGDNADELDLQRLPDSDVVFGAFEHLCLGVSIARVELEEFFRTMLALPGIWVPPQSMHRDDKNLTFLGPREYFVRCQPLGRERATPDALPALAPVALA